MEQILTAPEAIILSLSAIFAGIIILIKGGDWTIDSSIFVAERFKVSPLLIGFTIVAFGTSLPELIVSMNANAKGFPGLSVGNVVGSNIANILCVLGLTAVFATVRFEKSRQSVADSFVLLGSTLALTWLVMQEVITSVHGLLMVVFLFSYVVWQYKTSQKEMKEKKAKSKTKAKTKMLKDMEEYEHEHASSFRSLSSAVLFLLLGLISIALGAEVLVRGAVLGAKTLGVSELVIGLTIVALGTSLPELVTCIAAAKKKQSSIVIGNVIGSGVFNILSIIGLTAAFSPIDVSSVSARLMQVDIWILLAVTFAFVFYLLGVRRFGRLEGILMFLTYCVFNLEQYLSNL